MKIINNKTLSTIDNRSTAERKCFCYVLFNMLMSFPRYSYYNNIYPNIIWKNTMWTSNGTKFYF